MSERRLSVRRSTLVSRFGSALMVGAVAVLALAPTWGSRSTLKSLIDVLSLIALAQLWNLLAGYAGLVSIGQQAYVGLGAYSLIWLADNRGLNPFLAVGLSGLIAVVVSVPTATLLFRLREGYFAVGTWVVAEVFRLVVININSLDVGAGSGTSLLALSGYTRSDRDHYTYWIMLSITVVVVVTVYWLMRSRTGLGLRSTRDAEVAAHGLGVRVWRTRFAVYVLSAFGFGVTGAAIYLNLLRVQPDAAFSINYSAYMIFIVMIGGLGTIEGPIIGAVLFYSMQKLLADQGTTYLIILGSVAVLMMVAAPKGLWGVFRDRTGIELFPVERRLELNGFSARDLLRRGRSPTSTGPEALAASARSRGSASAGADAPTAGRTPP